MIIHLPSKCTAFPCPVPFAPIKKRGQPAHDPTWCTTPSFCLSCASRADCLMFCSRLGMQRGCFWSAAKFFSLLFAEVPFSVTPEAQPIWEQRVVSVRGSVSFQRTLSRTSWLVAVCSPHEYWEKGEQLWAGRDGDLSFGQKSAFFFAVSFLLKILSLCSTPPPLPLYKFPSCLLQSWSFHSPLVLPLLTCLLHIDSEKNRRITTRRVANARFICDVKCDVKGSERRFDNSFTGMDGGAWKIAVLR